MPRLFHLRVPFAQVQHEIRLSFGSSLLLSSSDLAGVVCGGFIVVLFLIVIVIGILTMCARWYPEAAFTIFQALILTGEIDALGIALATAGLAALGEVVRAGAQLGLHGCVGGDPVCECVFAVLDNPDNKISSVCSFRDSLAVGEVLYSTYALLAS